MMLKLTYKITAYIEIYFQQCLVSKYFCGFLFFLLIISPKRLGIRIGYFGFGFLGLEV
jgi:hypothetical protein